MVSVIGVFPFAVVVVDCVCWSLTPMYHVDVTRGQRVVVDVVWEIPTSFHHFTHSVDTNNNEHHVGAKIRETEYVAIKWHFVFILTTVLTM